MIYSYKATQYIDIWTVRDIPYQLHNSLFYHRDKNYLTFDTRVYRIVFMVTDKTK